MNAPHLPPKSCNVKFHQHAVALPGFLTLVGIALLAGFAAALAAVAWVVPTEYTGGFGRVSEATRAGENIPEARVANTVEQRTITVFDTTKKIDGAYAKSAVAGRAALLSSDGWAVMRVPSYRSGREKQWEGIDAQGTAHAVERVAFDTVAGLLYVKFSGDGFRIFPFADWQDIAFGASVWRLDHALPGNDRWRRVEVGEASRVSADGVFSIARPEYLHELQPSVEDGTLLVNDRGDFIGFSGKVGLLPGWLVESQLPRVLGGKAFVYDRVPLDGSVVEAVRVGDTTKLLSGFAVTRVGRGMAGIQRGDVLIRIGNEAVEPAMLSRALLLAPDEFSVSILRGGEEKTIILHKLDKI